MESIWKRENLLPVFPPLTADLKTEVAVIGGGMAGILIAYYLKQRGIQAVILEADRIGSGQTGNTTAKITVSHNLIYRKMLDTIGEELAGKYLDANQEAIVQYEDMIRKEKISCDFQKASSYLYSVMESQSLERELDALKRLGSPAEFTKNTELPFSVEGAIRYPAQGQFHPLEFLGSVAKGLEIYERTRVTTVEGEKVRTGQGHTVEAAHVVFATHYPFLNRPGYYFIRMHQERSYAIALRNGGEMEGMYLGVDKEKSYSFRPYGDLLLVGGEGHRTGENLQETQFRNLQSQASVWWPRSTTETMWSAQDCMTPDQIPYIGAYSNAQPNWHVATGFGKWGMTSSMVSAMVISDEIQGIQNPWKEVFSPQRKTTMASVCHMATDGLKAAKGLIRQAFTVPQKDADALGIGEGAIVEIQGHKTGVYKREDGKLFVVSVRCPHMGCLLEWNGQEKSWDCPCHGSRFDYKGNLLDNPAQKNIGGAENEG